MDRNDEHNICEMLPAVKCMGGNVKDVKNDLNIATDKLNTKLDAHSDADKCVNNNQNICNNRKNVKTINKTDCNVVIDDETQSKQQQKQLPPSQPQQQQPQKNYGCVHYKRKAKFVVSQRNRFFNYFEFALFRYIIV